MAEPEAFSRYTAAVYDSSADYWKLVKNENGTDSIVWYGKRDLTNEAGDLLQKDKTGSFSQSLMKYQVTGKEKLWDWIGNNMLTIVALCKLFHFSVASVRRRLKEWGALSSYNKSGRYYSCTGGRSRTDFLPSSRR